MSVNIGLPRDVAWRGKTVHTGIWKNPAQGRLTVRRLNIDGDGQGDLGGHGGVNRAVMVYQMDSYRHWQRELGRTNFCTGNLAKTSPSRGLPTTKCASVTATGSAPRSSKSHSRESRATASASAWTSRECLPCWSRITGPVFTFAYWKRARSELVTKCIAKVADGPEHMSVAEVDALLYLSGHTREQLVRALCIPALSAGWQGSLQAILQQETSGGPVGGNPGLAPTGPPPGWTGFRSLRVSRIEKESSSVVSLTLVPADNRLLVAALPGQFIVLRMRPKPGGPALLRNYSLSDLPAQDHYRVSVKLELNGAASTYVHNQVSVGDSLDVAAPRGSFTLQAGDKPVVLLSAGVGATPVLAMLHSLAAAASPRDVWWLFGARNSEDHPFAKESRSLIKALPHGKSYIRYSRPGPQDRPGVDFDASGRIAVDALEKLGVPRDADFYLCGPAAFMQDLSAGLAAWGVSGDRVHTEIFGPGKPITPGVVAASHAPPHPPQGPPGAGPLISFARSGLNVCWDSKFSNLLDFAEACDVPVRWSCRTGVCHMCESGLISGRINYEPEPLEPPAPGNLLICCSQPKGDVVIDL